MLAQYLSQIERVLGTQIIEGEIKLRFDYKTLQEAKLEKKRMVQMQRELRAIKASIVQEIKIIRTRYSNEMAKTSGSTVAATIFFGRRAGGRFNAARKVGLRNERDQALAPYLATKSDIDKIILAIENQKLEVDRWIAEHTGK